MLKTIIILTLAAILLCGCSGEGALLRPVPTKSAVFQVRYENFAECSYHKLSEAFGPGLTKADLPNEGEIKLTLASGGVQYFEATFKRRAARETTVEITAAQTLWGPYPSTARGFAAISSCAPAANRS